MAEPERGAWDLHSGSREKATFATANLLICFLVPAWSAFDFLLEPALALRFLLLRGFDVAVTVPLALYISRSEDVAKNRRAMAVSVLAVGLTIVAMLPQVRAHYLLYTFGFSLVFWGTGLLLVWPPRWAATTFSVLVAAYVAAHVAFGSHVATDDFVGSLFYIASAAIISCTQLVVRRRLEREAFDSARALAEREAQLRLRDEFISVAGHELRTPLSPIRLTVDMLLRTPSPDDKSRRLFTRLDAQVTRLTGLVTQLLDVSKLAAGALALEREPMDLSELARDVARHFEDDAAKVKTAITVAAAEPVVGSWDRVRLEQVVSNLVSNAVKYGPGKPIEVGVERRGEHAVLTVADQGIGIAPEDQARIFRRFERAVSTRNYGGFGLGLWIVARIVEELGGSVRVESEKGRGSKFIVELPVDAHQRGETARLVGSSRVDLQACKLEYSIVSPK